MDVREIGRGSMDWIHLAEDRDQWRALVHMVMNLRVPLNVGKFLSNCTGGNFSRRTQLHGVGWLVSSHSGDQEIPFFYGTRMFITVFTRARYWIISSGR
jgi:hypothetical protein